MKVIQKGYIPGENILIYLEDWSEDYPRLHKYADQLGAYPVSKASIPHFAYDGHYFHDYPQRGHSFRLGLHLRSTKAARQAFDDLTSGKTELADYANFFDTTPNTTANDYLECLFGYYRPKIEEV